MAPFPRDREFGGSQRATSIAEGLERRGFRTSWEIALPRPPSLLQRLASTVVGPPDLVRQYQGAVPDGRWDIVFAEHSFVAGRLPGAPHPAVPVVDFHNLESQQLLDIAAALPPLRRSYYALQSRRMASYEASVTRADAVSLLPSEPDLTWVRQRGGDGLVVPNTLPRATTESAARIWARRQSYPPARHPPMLLYVGKLDFLPNLVSLRRFLQATWPTIRAAEPAARLVVAGRLPPGPEGRLDGAGVEVLGFVEDLGGPMAECTAALMPLGIRGGTSLRVLWFALAGVPMIGSPNAFRGFDSRVGLVARSGAEWVDAVRVCSLGDQPVERLAEGARTAAHEVNSSDAPLDRLAELLWSRLRRGRGTSPTPR